MTTRGDRYRIPGDDERDLGMQLVGSRIAIFWDGDKVFYPCVVSQYHEDDSKHTVTYEEDKDCTEYREDLQASTWKIWGGTDEEYENERKIRGVQAAEEAKVEAADKIVTESKASSSRMSYAAMVVDAVTHQNDKVGSSIQAVRKYMTNTFQLKPQQTASFNNLTSKALGKAVALGILDYDKRLYRVSDAERERRKDKERASKAAAAAAVRVQAAALKQSQRASMKSSKGASAFSGRACSSLALVNGGDPMLTFFGTAAAYNKSLRKELINMRSRRDKFLAGRIRILRPFLVKKNYFARRAKQELDKKKERDVKRKEVREVRDQQVKAQVVTQAEAALSVDAGAPPGAPEASMSGRASPSLAPVPQAYLNMAPLTIPPPSEPACSSAPECSEPMVVLEKAEPVSATPAEEVEEEEVEEKEEIEEKEIEEIEEKEIEEEEEEEEESVADYEEDAVDDRQLLYSTMEGVKILPQPHTLRAELHEHQVTGISWMVHMFQQGMPMILADQMGLGKTIQSIGFLACLQQLNKKGPYLVVVPLSVLSNWLAEIERFCPSFRAVRFHGPKNERTRIKEEELHDLAEFDIVVTTYEILVSEVNFFRRKYVWTAVIVDEGHRLKNEKSQFSEKLRLVACLGKVILTGTPLQNNLRELWAMLYYLAPDVFQASKPFEEGFDLTRGHIDSGVLRRARKLLSVFMLRRLKEHVAIKLPSRREVTLLVPLTRQQHSLYKQLLCSLDSSTLEVVMRDSKEAKDEPDPASAPSDSASASASAPAGSAGSSSALSSSSSSSGGSGTPVADSDWRKLMNLLLQLRKVCNHTYLFPDIAPDPYVVDEEIVRGSGKLMMLDRMLPRLRANAHRVLIFSQFTSMLDLLEDYCELREYPFVRLDGETNRVKRRLDVRRFNAPRSPIFIFLISTRAGGLGLNLASADTVILYDSDWNPQVDLQAMERAHRIGQVKPVRVYRLVCRGSVEERMVSRAEKKLFLNAMVAEQDPDEQLHEAGTEECQEADAKKQAEISQALGIGGTAISKGELASLIRFGANAVFEGGGAGNSCGGDVLGKDITEEELDMLLEMQGRDQPPPQKEQSEADRVEVEVEVVDEIGRAQQALKDRMEMLQEVDLRQLGTTHFELKKKKKKARAVSEEVGTVDGVLDYKRVRKERVVMVDGKGTGYGGAVPMLAEMMEKEVEPKEDSGFRSRGRQWTHQCFCVMCGKAPELEPAPEETEEGKKKGKSKDPSGEVALEPGPAVAPVKCAHCPFIFHVGCINGPESGGPKVPRPSGMFICPHHRCVSCNRSTASAGGMLFRCVGCITSYCEDCLPQDEIDSVGRCRELEQCGYESKQAYYIRCPYCCQLDGFKPLGILNDNEEAEKQAKEKAEAPPSRRVSNSLRGDEDEDEPEELEGAEEGQEGQEGREPDAAELESGDDAIVPLKTQLMRLHWVEILPTPPPEPKVKGKKGKSKQGNGKSKAASPPDKKPRGKGDSDKLSKKRAREEDSEEEEEEDRLSAAAAFWRSGKARRRAKPAPSLSDALEALLQHTLWSSFTQVRGMASGEAEGDICSADVQTFAQVLNKIEAGRYRSGAHFAADARYVVCVLVKRARAQLKRESERIKLAELSGLLIRYLEEELGPSLAL